MDATQDYLDLKAWLEETRNAPLEGMASFFDARIGDYEEHMSPWNLHYDWLASLLPDGIASLLDAGCGTGLELDRIFRRFPDLAVTGIDLSAEMLDKLRQKHGDKDLTLIRDDYFTHDFGEGQFDAAVSFESLHHFPAERKVKFFSNVCHSLKPGGVYLECDYIAVSQEIEDLVFAELDRRRKRDGIAPDIFVHFDTPLTLEHERQAMLDGGFSQAELIGFLDGDSHTAMIRAVR